MPFGHDAYNVLIVEDNEGDLFITRTALDRSGVSCNIEVARNGEAALEFLYEQRNKEHSPLPDLALIDVNLPGISGREVIKKIRADKKLKHMQLVIMAGSILDQNPDDEINKGVNAIILKPVEPEHIRRLLEGIIEIDRQYLNSR